MRGGEGKLVVTEAAVWRGRLTLSWRYFGS